VTAEAVMVPVHPGEILLEEFLKALSLSQYQLAKELNVPARRINEIVHGERRITADTALRLALLRDLGKILDEPAGALRPGDGKGPARSQAR
jgi:addiction module HigA family antidote